TTVTSGARHVWGCTNGQGPRSVPPSRGLDTKRPFHANQRIGLRRTYQSDKPSVIAFVRIRYLQRVRLAEPVRLLSLSQIFGKSQTCDGVLERRAARAHVDLQHV